MTKPPTAIFFAGGEVETLTKALIDNGVDKILYSYWYIYSMRREGFIDRIQMANPHVKFFLDSGAFTYWAKYQKEPDKLVPWRKFKKLYFDYIEATWERWERIAELDLDRTFDEITLDLLAQWREEMLFRWPQANIMPVWHPNRGPEEWTSYCRDPRVKHLAIGSGGKDPGLTRRMLMEARMRNKTVHGFGMTKVKLLNYIPYDSVDSTSWLMGQKFGTLFVFQNNTFKLVGKDGSLGKSARKLYRGYFRKIGIDWKKVEADDVAEVRKANILAWRFLSSRFIEMRKRQNRTLFFEDRKERLNTDFVWARPRPRPRTEVEVMGHDQRAEQAPREDQGVSREGKP